MIAALAAQRVGGDMNATAAVGADDDILLDDQIAHLLRRAHQRASAIVGDALEDENLTPTQFFIMSRLSEIGTVSQNQLGRMTSMDPATTQGVIRRLRARGLIDCTSNPSDRRRIMLSLTRDGEDVLRRVNACVERSSDEILAPLDKSDRGRFVRLLRQLV
jgi:DNA-binding MarR family transcriptional regulator